MTRVTWLGHSTAVIELGGACLITDPVLRGRLLHLRRAPGPAPVAPPELDAVLVSHMHYDHLDLPSLRMLGGRPRILGPAGARDFLMGAGFRRVEGLQPGESAQLGRVRVVATAAEHAGSRRPGGPSATPLGFVVQGEHSLYFAGDTDLFEAMGELGPIDVALLPVAGWGPKLGPGHMDAERAARAAALIRPRVAIPIHWGTLHPVGRSLGTWFHDPPERFAAQVAELAPDVEVRVLAPGESLEL